MRIIVNFFRGFLLLLSKLDTREITPLGSIQIRGFLIGLLPIDNDLIPVSSGIRASYL
jgi:hypothetical protein